MEQTLLRTIFIRMEDKLLAKYMLAFFEQVRQYNTTVPPLEHMRSDATQPMHFKKFVEGIPEFKSITSQIDIFGATFRTLSTKSKTTRPLLPG